MNEFLSQHADIVLYIFGGLLGLAVYFYKSNEIKANLIISTKLDNIAEKINGLCAKNTERKAEARELFQRTSQLEAQAATQRQRCDDRAVACPGAEARRDLEKLRGN